MRAKFRKKPVVIDAVRITEEVRIKTREGELTGLPGEWLITGIHGEKYPCGDDIFQQTYEAANEATPDVQLARAILATGHNTECLFCGLKDRLAVVTTGEAIHE